MGCRRIQSLLSAYSDRELSNKEQQTVRQHLAFCTECQKEYEGILNLKRALDNLEEIELPNDIHFYPDCNLGEDINQSGILRAKKIILSTAACLCFLSLAGIFHFISILKAEEVSSDYLISEHISYTAKQPLVNNFSLSLILNRKSSSWLE